MLNHLEISKAGILRTLYPTPLDFLNAYKLEPKVDEKLVKKWKFTCYSTYGYEFLVPASTIKAKEKESALKPVTLELFLLLFKEIKGSSTKVLCSLFLFRGKVFEAEGEDFEFDEFMFSKNVFVAGSLQKRKAGKAFKKSFKKKLKIGPAESLVFGEANRKKGKAIMIAEANGEDIVRESWPK